MTEFPARNPPTAGLTGRSIGCPFFSNTRCAPELYPKEKKDITGLLADLAMAIRSTSTNIDIGNATTETGTQRPPTVTSTPGKAEALLGLRTRKTYFTLAFDLELTDGLAVPTSMR